MPSNPAKAMLLVDATYRLDTVDVDAFAALPSRMSAAANRRDGCVFLKVAQDLDHPTTFHLFESWRDQGALDAHLESDAFQAVLKEAAGLKIIERSADVYMVDGAKRLDTPF